MVVAAFIIAMLITPSPEITTQFTLAAPTILMYQIGILLVWMRHRQLKPKKVSGDTLEQKLVEEVSQPHVPQPVPEVPATSVVAVAPSPRSRITPGRVDVLMRYKPAHARNTTVAVPSRQKPTQDIFASQARPQVNRPIPRVSIDGFFPASDT